MNALCGCMYAWYCTSLPMVLYILAHQQIFAFSFLFSHTHTCPKDHPTTNIHPHTPLRTHPNMPIPTRSTLHSHLYTHPIHPSPPNTSIPSDIHPPTHTCSPSTEGILPLNALPQCDTASFTFPAHIKHKVASCPMPAAASLFPKLSHSCCQSEGPA